MRQKIILVTFKGYVAYDPKVFGAASEAERKVTAAKEALTAAGITITAFGARPSSMEATLAQENADNEGDRG